MPSHVGKQKLIFSWTEYMAALDLRKCGMGNVLLLAAAHLVASPTGQRPVIAHDSPETELHVLDTTFFRVVHPDSARIDPSLNARYCNVRTLFSPDVQHVMRYITRIPEWIRVAGDAFVAKHAIDVGLCFRISDPALDGNDQFMNDASCSKMIRIASRSNAPFVCSNDSRILQRIRSLLPHSICVDCSTYGVRNAEEHILQWYILSKCPVVYHGNGGNGGISSTFAPTAAVYGNSHIVGVDNAGRVHPGNRYCWIYKTPVSRSVELVVARYDEDVSWISQCAADRVTVYDKGSSTTERSIRLPNVGREGHTYLTHIIHAYDNLADTVVFTQGRYDDHVSRDAFMGLVRGISPPTRIGLDIPWKSTAMARYNWTVQRNHPRSPEMKPAEMTLGEYYTSLGITTAPLPSEPSVPWWPGAIFSVACDDIRRLPKSAYIRMLQTIDGHPHPETVHYLERLWWLIFHGTLETFSTS
jgi:hypothetical protein